jgi:HK97 family phage prohead protease
MTKAIARTGRSANQVGGLELSEDKRGLRVFARLDPADPDVTALAVKMKRGIVDQMSFAFTVERDERVTITDEEEREDTLRTILEVRDLYDVTVVAQGAYPQTDASIRSLLRYASEDGRAFGRAGELIAPTSAGGSAQSSIAPPAGAAELERTLARVRAEATQRLARARQRIAA